MGCCVSTNNEAKAEADSISKKDQQLVRVGSDEACRSKGFSHESRAPPEEETVKEVLSETPKPKAEPNIDADEVKQNEQEEEKTKIGHKKPEAFAKIQEITHQDDKKKKQNQNQNLSNNNNEEVMSEVSEICSASMSMSMSMSECMSTMTNVTDKREIEEEPEVTQLRVSSRSPAKPPQRNGFKRDRVLNQSPTRRPDQSPGRRIGNNGQVRLVQSGREETGQAIWRRGPASDPVKREPGECSGRRSKSPATARSSATMGRNPSGKKGSRSPGRVRTDPVESSHNGSREVGGRNTEVKWPSNNNNSCSTNESLENPFVSLECFIFL